MSTATSSTVSTTQSPTPSQAPTAAPGRDHAPALERAFPDAFGEASYPLTEVTGTLPPALRGTYYVNGPARFARGGQRYGHWLDGDGMVAALALAGGRARLTHRYVRSHKLAAEEGAGRALFRAFGTGFEGDRLLHGLALASPVNVSVHPYRGKLLAFGEQGLPWELDPETLETRREHTFDGRLKAVTPFAAHPNFDAARGEMFNFGVSFSAASPSLNLYRFAAGGALVYRARHRLPWPCSIHDFGLSERFAVFHVSPYVMDMAAFRAGGATPMDCLRWRPELGTALWVFAREDGRLLHRTPIGEGYCLHMVHCHEAADLLHVDVLEMEEPVYDQYALPDLFPDARLAAIRRYTVDPRHGDLVARTELECRQMIDFPALDPRSGLGPYDSFWVLGIGAAASPGRKFFDRLLRYDRRQGGAADRYQAPPGCYLGGEPVFLPDPGRPGRGYTLCQELDARRGIMRFLLFDAFELAAGPLARLELRAPIHLGFHACWHPAA
ncbi:MAG: carotenoid oxygenase family protein [Acidobacteriota bacterium]|nr:carotenoid oxygenase family protein [Acidobacteriota bacterium]MDH3524623.1 carotenoid oxygenase family protein [Acidobacteriota bacterium]